MGRALPTVRHALRSLRRSPGFVLTSGLTLSLGIGAVTCIFSLLSALVLDVLPYPQADRLVHLARTTGQGSSVQAVAPAEFVAWREADTGFEDLAALRFSQVSLAGEQGAERVRGFQVSPGLFKVLRQPPLLGRALQTDASGRPEQGAVVIGAAIWERRFGRSPAVLGQTIRLDGVSHTVVGVMARGTGYPPNAEFWTPLEVKPDQAQRASLQVIGRLRPGVELERAARSLEIADARYAADQSQTGRGIQVQRLQDYETGYTRMVLGVLSGAVAFVLLIACANLAILLLVRAEGRREEWAVRVALGGGKGRIVGQICAEAVLVALAAAALGTALGMLGIRLLKGMIPPDLASFVSGWDRLGLDARTLVFAIALAVLTSVLFAAVPALRAARTDPARALREGGRSGSARRSRAYRALVVSEVAFALVLLVMSGLTIQSVWSLLRVDPGFRSDGVLTLELLLPPERYQSAEVAREAYGRVLPEVGALPGVQAVGLISALPQSRMRNAGAVEIEGATESNGEPPVLAYQTVTPGYFEALRIPLLRGRMLGAGDRAGAPPVVLVNQAMAQRYWPDGDAVGKRVRLGTWHEVVGVVGDVRQQGARATSEPELYLPQAQSGGTSTFLVLRAVGDPEMLGPSVRRVVAQTDPEIAVSQIRSMERVVREFVAPDRLIAALLATFAAVALVLAGGGLYGVVAYSVAQQRRTLGIHMAMGAAPADVLRRVLRQALTTAGLGVAIGLALALAASRGLAGLLYGVAPASVAMPLGVAALLLGISLLASYFPARRAAHLDPSIVLRHD